MSELAKSYGELIKKRRSFLNLRQSDLAIFLSTNIQGISKLENDQIKIDCVTLNELLKVLKIDIISFINKDIKAPITNNFDNFNSSLFAKSLEYYRKLNYYSVLNVSEATYISRYKLSKMEQNETSVYLEDFLILASFYHLDYETFFYSKNSNLFYKIDNKEKNEGIVNFKNVINMTYLVCGLIALSSIFFNGLSTKLIVADYYETNNELIERNFDEAYTYEKL